MFDPKMGVGSTTSLPHLCLSQLLVMLSFWYFEEQRERRAQPDNSFDFQFHLCDEGNTDPNKGAESTEQMPLLNGLKATLPLNSWSAFEIWHCNCTNERMRTIDVSIGVG